jgi:hypothetical protein
MFGRVGYRTLLESCPQAAARITERAEARTGVSVPPGEPAEMAV